MNVSSVITHVRSVMDPGIEPIRGGTPEQHIRWMLTELHRLESEKQNRWVGFIQGWLWATGRATIDEMRRINADN